MGRKVVGTRSRSSLQSHSYVEVLEESFAHSKEPLKFLIEDKDLSRYQQALIGIMGNP